MIKVDTTSKESDAITLEGSRKTLLIEFGAVVNNMKEFFKGREGILEQAFYIALGSENLAEMTEILLEYIDEKSKQMTAEALENFREKGLNGNAATPLMVIMSIQDGSDKHGGN